MNVSDQLKNHFYNLPGWRTNRRILVIESDDWGSIRMRSKADFEALSGQLPIHKNPFNRFDSLETADDLEALFEVLASVKDQNGNAAKITANFVTSNPDFEKIKASDFSDYFFEDFTQSYATYQGSDKAMKRVTEGMRQDLFFPQFHGREHVQAEYWMRDLKAAKPQTRLGFEHGFFGFGKNELDGRGYLSAFDATDAQGLEKVKIRIKEGLDQFEKSFGFRSESVIAPQNTMHYELLPFLKACGVSVIQGARVNKQFPINPGDKPTYKRFMGRKNDYGQTDIVRNATFEPSSGKIDWTAKCLAEIGIAFAWKKPAVICSHRFNFIGSLDPKNRENGLAQLQSLLHSVLKKWPDTEFMTTLELAQLIPSKPA